MNLNIAETFLLLHMKPQRAGYYRTGHALTLGLTGAILLDLSAWKHFHMESGRIVINDIKHELQEPHLEFRDRMRVSKKPLKIKRWLSKFSGRSGRYQKAVFNQLIAKDVLFRVPLRFLGIPYNRYVLHPDSPRTELVSSLRDVVFGRRKFKGNDMEILGLLGACKLHHLICENRKEIRECRRILSDLVRDGFVNKEVDELLRETQAAVIGAIAASAAASAAAGASAATS